ncbi:cupin [Rhizorhabdus wittichii DC-6]|uniref:Cupin 2, conserved barrel domain protein n=1 Tax=Rhizorhabdus wittichii (strain DSM 6014 / CCUG 31198 / JCM 15750 / NBRC 105917 / EY 4224 / RW1) TaxID=392499 RepID=A0A9J9HAR2_RHIWR|nr:Cupin 2, conserved barrel domain protein [Rhizorhabdus wittichii RW1]ARR54961.1 cupin [Rhizorhabdus wittichii DC-6]
MKVTRFDAAEAYFPAGHVDMRCYRLQGRDDAVEPAMLLNLCHFLPGGSTGSAASPAEKLYLVLEGELTVSSGGREELLGPWDSCRIAPGEARLIENRSHRPASILLVMTNADAAPKGPSD